jgi:hypothetical protein
MVVSGARVSIETRVVAFTRGRDLPGCETIRGRETT